MKISIISIFFSFILQHLLAQTEFRCVDTVYDPHIQTIQFFQSGTLYSYPIIDLAKPEESLLLSFDVLDKPQQDFQYSIIHCNADWQPSNLFTNDYLNGSTYESVSNYEPSFNCIQHYFHYFLYVPGNYMTPKISGNYLLKVYLADNPDSIIITRRFYVISNQVAIAAEVKQPTYAKYRNSKQEVDFSINYQGLKVMNPLQDLKVVIRQNQRWDNQIVGLTPKYVNDQVMNFDYEEENLFDGAGEFRKVDLRSYRNAGWGVQKIYLDSFYHLMLYADDDRSYKSYSFWSDINGERIIASNTNSDKSNELDYLIAHFRLLTPYPYDEGSVYLFGALSDWQIKPEFKMNYIHDRNCYEAAVKLKQGYYNFQYAFVDKQNNKIDIGRFEGDHYETENDYLILVYFKSAFLNADLLMGTSILKSPKK